MDFNTGLFCRQTKSCALIRYFRFAHHSLLNPMHYYQELQKEKKQGQGTNKGNGFVRKGNINGSIEQYFIDKMLYSIIPREGLCLSSEVK